MTILNWLFWKKQQLIKTEANNAKTDLVVLGAEVPFTKRDDGYQDYAMSLADAVAAGCTENNTIRTGIYDNFPFPIGYPVMLKTCTKVIDTPASPTFIAVDLQGWKVVGSIEINDGIPFDVLYLGSVEFGNNNFWDIFPWKTTGTVYTFDDDNSIDIYSAFTNGAIVFDNNAFATTKADFYITTDYYPGGVDLYLTYNCTDPGAQLTGSVASFEFEFLHPTTSTPTFIQY